MRKPNWSVLGLVLVLGSLLVAACGQAKPAPLASGQLVISASEWKFEPNSVRLEAAKPVKLVLRNVGKIEHNVVISAPGAGGDRAQVDAGAGQTASVEFTPQEPGLYEIACTLPGHREAGMVAKLEVLAAGAAGP